MTITSIGKTNQTAFKELLRGLPLKEGTPLGILENDKIAGIALVKDAAANIEISYLYILPEFRGKGIGSDFIEEMTYLSREEDKEAILTYTPPGADVSGFLKKCGFTVVRTADIYSFKVEDLFKSEKMKMLLERSRKENVVHPNDLSVRMFRDLKESCKKYAFDSVLFDKGLYDNDLSFVARDERGVKAVLFAQKTEKKKIYITLLANFMRSYPAIVSVMGAFEYELVKHERGCEVCFLSRSDDAYDLIKKLLPDEGMVEEKGGCDSAMLRVI